jgi:hypothetical protein
MTHVELPRPLEAYFAFAELPSGRDARRFTITFTYFAGDRLDRLQWWWQAGNGQLRVGGEPALDALRREATARFRAHIETWLLNSHRRLSGGEPFPHLEMLPVQAAVPSTAPAADSVVSQGVTAAEIVTLGTARKGQAA